MGQTTITWRNLFKWKHVKNTKVKNTVNVKQLHQADNSFKRLSAVSVDFVYRIFINCFKNWLIMVEDRTSVTDDSTTMTVVALFAKIVLSKSLLTDKTITSWDQLCNKLKLSIVLKSNWWCEDLQMEVGLEWLPCISEDENNLKRWFISLVKRTCNCCWPERLSKWKWIDGKWLHNVLYITLHMTTVWFWIHWRRVWSIHVVYTHSKSTSSFVTLKLYRITVNVVW